MARSWNRRYAREKLRDYTNLRSGAHCGEKEPPAITWLRDVLIMKLMSELKMKDLPAPEEELLAEYPWESILDHHNKTGKMLLRIGRKLKAWPPTGDQLRIFLVRQRMGHAIGDFTTGKMRKVIWSASFKI